MNNVEFYETLKNLQVQQQDSERRRWLLEQQLSMQTEKKIHTLRISQLQNYWQKICEDEKRSQRRNEQLLRDLNRIDEHAARLAERTESLRNLKLEYESYIEKTYPNWKDKLMLQRNQRLKSQHAANGFMHQDEEIGENLRPNQEHHQSPIHSHDSFELPKQISRESSIVKQQNGSFEKHQEPVGNAKPQSKHKTHEQHLQSHQYDQSSAIQKYSHFAEVSDSSTAENGNRYTKLEAVPEEMERFDRRSIDANRSIAPSLVDNVPSIHPANTTNVNSFSRRTSDQSSVADVPIDSVSKDLPRKNSASSPMKISIDKNLMPASTPIPSSKTSESDPSKNGLPQNPDLEKEDFMAGKERYVSNTSPKEQKTLGSDHKPHRNVIQGDGTDESDIEEIVQHNENLSNSNDPQSRLTVSSLAPLPDVSFQGFCRMLTAVEDEVTFGNSFKFYVQLTAPPTPVVQEIIRAANGSDSLSHLNVESIAIVILEQLPCLSMNSRNSCILTDRILSSLDGDVDNEMLRCQLNPSDYLLWDALYHHFIVLLQYEVLSPAEIAEIFSPLLTGEKSRKQKQAVALIKKILEAVPPEDLHIPTPNSTSNFSFLSPRKLNEAKGSQPSVDANQLHNSASARPLNEEVLEKAVNASLPQSPVHGLHLEMSINKSSLREPQGTLTQTAAYKQLLASTITSQTMNGEDSDGDDEIERNLSLHFSETRQAQQKISKDGNILLPLSPGHEKLLKAKTGSDQTKLDDKNLSKQETERRESFALTSASIKSGRSTIENIISRAEEDFDLDEDNSTALSKVPETKHDDDDDDFWA